MSDHIHKSNNVFALLYHAVCPTKYLRTVITKEVDSVLRRVCLDIRNRYEITFLKIGADQNHVYLLVKITFLVQSVPMYSPKQIVLRIKSITTREMVGRVRASARVLLASLPPFAPPSPQLELF